MNHNGDNFHKSVDFSRSSMDTVTLGINEFSEVLTGFLQTINGNVSQLQRTQEEMAHSIKLLEIGLESTVREVAQLQMEASSNKKKVDDMAYSVNNSLLSPSSITSGAPLNLTQDFSSIDSTSVEIPVAATNTQPPMSTISRQNVGDKSTKPASKDFSLKVQLGKALNDAVHKFSVGVPKVNPGPKLNRGQSVSDPFDDRLQRIENSLLIQENINKISAAIAKSNNESFQFEIESLQNQIKKLEADLHASRSENDVLKSSISDVYAKFITYSNSRQLTPTVLSRPISTAKSTHYILTSPTGQGLNFSEPNSTTSAGAAQTLLSTTSGGEISESSTSSKKFWKQSKDPPKTPENNAVMDPALQKEKKNVVELEEKIAEVNARVEHSILISDSIEKQNKKLSAAIDDVVSQFENLRSKVDNLQSDGNNQSSSSLNNKNVDKDDDERVFSKKISKLRNIWSRLFMDLKFSLLRRAVERGDVGALPNAMDNIVTEDSVVLRGAEEFANIINSALQEFEPKGTTAETSAVVFPKLDQMTSTAEDLLATDDAVLSAKKFDPVLDDLVCEDGTKSIRQKILDAINASTPVMEDIDDKVFIRRKLNKMETNILKKAEFSSLKHIEHELKKLIGTKLEREDLIQALEKKASLSDIDRLRDLIHRKLGGKDVGANEYQFKLNENELSEATKNVLISQTKTQIDEMKEDIGKVVSELTSRFELVHRHFKDLEMFCDSFVPRSEVEEAMHALFQEVKMVKSQSVTQSMLKDGLRLKADADELQRLVTTLSSAVGELNGYSEATALHARCLVCDKPVTMLSRYRNPNQIGYDKRDEIPEQEQPPNLGRSASPERKIANNKDKVKIATDITILRNTIDLPPITDTNHASSKYHQRVRTTVGGGMGTNWTMDTR